MTAVLDAPPCRDLKCLSFCLELQTLAALPTVLATTARLGCRLVQVHADETQTAIDLLAPARVAHRVRGCLGQLVEVLTIEET